MCEKGKEAAVCTEPQGREQQSVFQAGKSLSTRERAGTKVGRVKALKDWVGNGEGFSWDKAPGVWDERHVGCSRITGSSQL